MRQSHPHVSSTRGAVTGVLVFLACLVVAALGPVPTAQAAIDPGSITGTVTDVAGDPLPGIAVTVLRLGRTWETQTDAAGVFRVDDLAADSYGYFVRFRDPGGTHATEWYDDQAFLLPASLTNVPARPSETTRRRRCDPGARSQHHRTRDHGRGCSHQRGGRGPVVRVLGDRHPRPDRRHRPLHHRAPQAGALRRGVLRPRHRHPGVLGRQSDPVEGEVGGPLARRLVDG